MQVFKGKLQLDCHKKQQFSNKIRLFAKDLIVNQFPKLLFGGRL
ncbi:hypothetical protein HMPREF0813_00036 [Streptococcus anginosus F0211]|uniref:Uncharacterized protein n=1 Tax=Streptococcus anginosus F0211 TaxID=706437 RepID=E6IYH4_STRAP|nr:hypothetical protein HMPREF0813_00036 [Streptococcus anginosus F0211]